MSFFCIHSANSPLREFPRLIDFKAPRKDEIILFDNLYHKDYKISASFPRIESNNLHLIKDSSKKATSFELKYVWFSFLILRFFQRLSDPPLTLVVLFQNLNINILRRKVVKDLKSPKMQDLPEVTLFNIYFVFVLISAHEQHLIYHCWCQNHMCLKIWVKHNNFLQSLCSVELFL